MSKPELGVKRLCANCGAKFYDLHRDPIVCPKCASVFVPRTPAPIPPRRLAHRWPAPVEKAAMPEGVAEDEATSVETLDGAAVLAEEDDADEDVGSIVGDGEKDKQA